MRGKTKNPSHDSAKSAPEETPAKSPFQPPGIRHSHQGALTLHEPGGSIRHLSRTPPTHAPGGDAGPEGYRAICYHPSRYGACGPYRPDGSIRHLSRTPPAHPAGRGAPGRPAIVEHDPAQAQGQHSRNQAGRQASRRRIDSEPAVGVSPDLANARGEKR